MYSSVSIWILRLFFVLQLDSLNFSARALVHIASNQCNTTACIHSHFVCLVLFFEEHWYVNAELWYRLFYRGHRVWGKMANGARYPHSEFCSLRGIWCEVKGLSLPVPLPCLSVVWYLGCIITSDASRKGKHRFTCLALGRKWASPSIPAKAEATEITLAGFSTLCHYDCDRLLKLP